MVEQLDDAKVEAILGKTKLDTFKDKIQTDVDTVEDFSDGYDQSGVRITQPEFQFVIRKIGEILKSSTDAIRDWVGTDHTTNLAVEYILKAQRIELRKAWDTIHDDYVLIPSATPGSPDREVPIIQLDLDSYVANYQDLIMLIVHQNSKKDKNFDINSLKRAYLKLLNHEAAQILPDLTQQVADLLNEQIELFQGPPGTGSFKTDTLANTFNLKEPVYLDKAKLSPAEVDGLKKLMQENNLNILLKSLDKNGDNFLTTIYRYAAGFMGERGNKLVGTASEELVKLRDTLLKMKKDDAQADIFGISVFDDYGFDQSRADQLIQLIDRALAGKDEVLEAWENGIEDTLVETDSGQEHLDVFLNRLERSKKANDAFQAADKEVLAVRRLLKYLRSVKQNINSVVYAVDRPAGMTDDEYEEARAVYNSYIRNAKFDFLENLTERFSVFDRSLAEEEVILNNTSEREKIAVQMYEELRRRNPNLPSFETLTPADAKTLNREITYAIFEWLTKLTDISASSGGTKRNLPDGPANFIEQMTFSVNTTLASSKQNLEYFFTNFPWQVVSPGVSEEAKYAMWDQVWRIRMVHFLLIHTSAAQFAALRTKEKTGEHTQSVIDLLATKSGSGGNYGEADEWYKSHYDMDKPLEAELAGIMGLEDGIDDVWIVGRIEKYFTMLCDINLVGINTENLDWDAKMIDLYKDFVDTIPAKYRKPGDENMIKRAWDMNVWKLYINLKMYGYDEAALSFKMAEALKLKDYLLKVTRGAGNTGKEWHWSAEVYKAILLELSDFAHYFIEVTPDNMRRVSFSEVMARYYQVKADLEVLEQVTNPTPDQKRKLKKTRAYVKALKRFVNDTIERAGGFPAEVTNAGGAKVAFDAKSTAQYNWDWVDKVYQLAWVNDGHLSLDLPEADLYKLPLAIPQEHIEIAMMQRGIKKIDMADGKPGQMPQYVMVSLNQIDKSGLNPSYVEWPTVTPEYKAKWVKAATNLMGTFEMLALDKKDNIFTPVEDLHEKPLRNIEISTLPDDLQEIGLGLRAQWKRVFGGDWTSYAERYSAYATAQIRVPEMDIQTLANGWKFSKVTQTTGRYGWGNQTQNGAVMEVNGESFTHPVGDIWRRMWRAPWKSKKGVEVEVVDHHGHAHKKKVHNFRKLAEARNKALVAKHYNTGVPRIISRAAREVVVGAGDGSDKRTEQLRRRAETTLILEDFMSKVAMYLDKYTYTKDVPFNPGIETVDMYSQLELACRGLKPMHAGHREMFIVACVKQIEDFKTSAVYGGHEEATRIGDTYNRSTIENMMRERGILGSQMQIIADKNFIENELKTLSTVESDKKKKGGH